MLGNERLVNSKISGKSGNDGDDVAASLIFGTEETFVGNINAHSTLDGACGTVRDLVGSRRGAFSL